MNWSLITFNHIAATGVRVGLGVGAGVAAAGVGVEPGVGAGVAAAGVGVEPGVEVGVAAAGVGVEPGVEVGVAAAGVGVEPGVEVGVAAAGAGVKGIGVGSVGAADDEAVTKTNTPAATTLPTKTLGDFCPALAIALAATEWLPGAASGTRNVTDSVPRPDVRAVGMPVGSPSHSS